MGEEIILEKNPKKIKAALCYQRFGQPIIKNILLGSGVAGVLTFLIYIYGFFFALPAIDFYLKALIFAGIFSALSYFYIFHYLVSYFKPTGLEARENYFSYFDAEATALLGKTNLEDPNLLDLFSRLLETRRCRFVLGEAQIEKHDLDTLMAGMPSSVSDYLILKNILVDAYNFAQQERALQITTADIFYGFVAISKNAEKFLLRLELNEEDLGNVIFWANRFYFDFDHPKTVTERLKASAPGVGSNWASGYTLHLDRFTYELGPQAHGSVQCRGEILERIEDILTKETRDNCILVGPSGVGKSILINELAKRVYWGQTVGQLSHCRVLMLDLPAIISYSNKSGDFEGILVACLNEAVAAGNIILYVDEIQNLFYGGKEGTIDASELLEPYLAGVGLKMIGTTTESAYETYIAPKSNIAGKFEKVVVTPTNKNQTIRILEDLAFLKSVQYGVGISYFAIKAVYEGAERYGSQKEFPARATDLLDEIFSASRNTGIKQINRQTVAKLLERDLGLPVEEAGSQEKEKLVKLEEKIHERVIGQNEAVKVVSDALKRARTKGAEVGKPIGAFLFLGPTGVGKTELAKALSAAYFGNEESLMRFDFNQYTDSSAVDRFIGKKLPGKEELEGGEFVKKIKEKPFSVVLLDEFEKASSKIQDVLLQALDEGYITDGIGNKVNLENSILIATSNAGAELIREGVMSGTSYDVIKNNVIESVQKNNIFKPEFLNRFDAVVVFRSLTRLEIYQVAELMFAEIIKGYKEKGYKITLEDGVLAGLAEKGYQPELGARPMRRVFQDVLETYLANAILNNRIKKGDEFIVKKEELLSINQG